MNPVDLNTIIKTPTGWLSLGALRPGDAVTTRSGQRAVIDTVRRTPPADLYELVTSDNRVIPSPHDRLWAVWSVADQASASLSTSELFRRQAAGEAFCLPVYRSVGSDLSLSNYLKTLPDPAVLQLGSKIVVLETTLPFDPQHVTQVRDALWSYGAVIQARPDPTNARVTLNAEFRRLIDFSVRKTHRPSDSALVRLIGPDQSLIAKDYVVLPLTTEVSIPYILPSLRLV